MFAILRITFVALALGWTTFSQAQKTQTFTVSRDIALPAAQVWAVVGEDFGGIANSHPKIVSSSFNQGTITAGEGAERVCNYNAAGTKFVKEKQLNYDPEHYSFSVQVFHADGLPLDPELTQAEYKIVPLDDQHSRFEFTMTFRTKPAFLGALAKGKFKKTIADYAIAVEHYARTQEAVNQENFSTIKALYQ